MFLLGIFSLMQVILLPGLIGLHLLRFQGTLLQRVVYTFALSLLINYCVVFVLTALSLHSRILILLLFVVQAIWLIWLYWADWRLPLIDVFRHAWDDITSALARLFHSPPHGASAHQQAVRYAFLLFTLISLFFALDRAWWFFKVFLDNLGTVFDGWDSVYSWNRWARAWFNGGIPLDSRFYPQLVPVNWSLTYIFIGDSTVQLFANSIMPIFAIGILLQFFDLGISLQKPGFFVGIILLRSLFVRFVGTAVNNGYVDTAMAFFALLPFYTLWKAQSAKTESERRVLWILGFFFAAAAAITKQAGVYIFLIYPFLVYMLLLRTHYGYRLSLPIWRDVLFWMSISALIPLLWYGLKFLLIFQGIDSSEVLGNANISAQAYGNVAVLSQIFQSLQKLGVFLLLLPLILFTLPLLPPLVRWLFFLFLLPFPILWSVMASYDTRNLAPWLPILALSGGLAIESVFCYALTGLARIKIEKLAFNLVPIVLITSLFVLASLYPDSRIHAIDMAARQSVFSPSLNRELHGIYANNPNTLILTNYPVSYITGLDSIQISCAYTDVREFERLMQNNKISHLLVPSVGVNPEITKQIEQWVEENKLIFVFQDKGSSIILFKLYAVKR